MYSKLTEIDSQNVFPRVVAFIEKQKPASTNFTSLLYFCALKTCTHFSIVNGQVLYFKNHKHSVLELNSDVPGRNTHVILLQVLHTPAER